MWRYLIFLTLIGHVNSVRVITNGEPASVHIPCSVPCYHSRRASFSNLRKVTIEGLPYEFVQSMEGPAYYPQLRINSVNHTKKWSTTSFRSTIPLPYFSWAEYHIQSPSINPQKVKRAASFIARNCQSKNNRERLVRELMKYTSVESLSSCLHNAVSPVGNTNKARMMQQYLFTLAFENQCEEDYITEKLWGALESGTLPVYFGAPNVHEHVPQKSILVVEDFSSIKALADYMNYLAKNSSAYLEYHAWRKVPLPKWFVQKYNFTHTHSDCRMCQWAYKQL